MTTIENVFSLNDNENYTIDDLEVLGKKESIFDFAFKLILVCYIFVYIDKILVNMHVYEKRKKGALTKKKELIEENGDYIEESVLVNDINNLNKIIGLESVKDEIRYYMDFINNKEKYELWDVKLPKGVLLAGPPGTGKTLLVKTMAESLNIPFETACGSEFVEVYVGVGASRIRDLFIKAKKYDKCIIFIDEIDAIGRKRGHDHNSERDNTLNQLLVEMDGFNKENNIIVFAATNMVRNLDNALTRSGRFDKKIYFDPPNFKERTLMYKMYLTNVIIPEHITFEYLSEMSAGLTGADIANICNLAKIKTIQKNNESANIDSSENIINYENKDVTIGEIQILESIDEVMIGREKRERTMTPDELFRVAHHEAGHAIIGYILKHCSEPVKVSIVPRGEAALGFSQQKSENKKLLTDDMIFSKIAVLLAGRGAEKLILNNLSSGAHDDIEKASALIYNYVVNWGMHSKFGVFNPDVLNVSGEKIKWLIFNECRELMNKIEEKVDAILRKNKRFVLSLALELLKNETIKYDDIRKILPDKLENSGEITL